jgi:hypothetical protein
MLGIRLIQVAAIYMVLGLGLGMAMGISSDYSFSSVHTHVLLLGWVTMAIVGTIYRVAPGCAHTRLATLRFWGHNAELPIMIVGLVFKASGQKNAEPTIAAGSTIVLLALIFFAVSTWRKARLEYGARRQTTRTSETL